MLRRRKRAPSGATTGAVGGRALRAKVDELGEAGKLGLELDRRAVQDSRKVASLSPLSMAVAVGYVGRLKRPLTALQEPVGLSLVIRGYAAHLLVESNPATFGVEGDIPVLGSFPKPGRADALARGVASLLVKVSKQNFQVICPLAREVWQVFVLSEARRVHDQVRAGGAGDWFLSEEVIDSLLRFGWLLRQADLHYGLSPRPRSETD